MKNQKALQTIAAVILVCALGPVAAEESMSAMAAPKCDLEQIHFAAAFPTGMCRSEKADFWI